MPHVSILRHGFWVSESLWVPGEWGWVETQVSGARPGAPGVVVGRGLRRGVRCPLRAGGEGRACGGRGGRVTDGQDLGALVVGEVDGEGLFRAEDHLCEVRAINRM